MRKKIFIYRLAILIMFALIFTIGSCNKDSFSGKSEDQIGLRTSMPTNAEVYEIRKDFAQTFYKAMASEAGLRSFIYQKCQIADTSGYELVYISLKDKTVSRGLKFSEILTLYADPRILRKYGNDFFSTLTNLTPLLTISFPDLENIQLSTWNSTITPSLVAVSTLNDRAFTMYNVNNLNGNEIILSDLQTEEDVINSPVLVIHDAENHYLVNDEGITHQGVDIEDYMPQVPNDPRDPGNPGDPRDCWLYFLDAQTALENYIISGQSFYLVEHNILIDFYIDCLDLNGGGDPPPNPCPEPCERDCEEIDEHLVDFKINGWGVYSNIHNQLFETKYVFHAAILIAFRDWQGNISTLSEKMVTKAYKKKDIIDCSPHPCQGIWRTESYRIWTDWKKDLMGSPYQVTWAEVDNGQTTLNLKLSFGASFKIKEPTTGAEITETAGVEIGYSFVGDKIVELGNAPVFYCDPINLGNNTGSISFRCD